MFLRKFLAFSTLSLALLSPIATVHAANGPDYAFGDFYSVDATVAYNNGFNLNSVNAQNLIEVSTNGLNSSSLFTIVNSGTYLISYNTSFNRFSGGQGILYSIGLRVNNTNLPSTKIGLQGNDNGVYALSGTVILALNAGDVVELVDLDGGYVSGPYYNKLTTHLTFTQIR